MDTNLVELARKWINRLLPLVRFTSFISSTVLYDASFSYLLDAGCEPIGFDYRGIYIYMKCKSRLIRVIPPSQYQSMFREVLSKMPKLDTTTINRLTTWGFSDSFIKTSLARVFRSPVVLARGAPMTRRRMLNEGGGEGTSPP